jgi:hypothetical protein
VCDNIVNDPIGGDVSTEKSEANSAQLIGVLFVGVDKIIASDVALSSCVVRWIATEAIAVDFTHCRFNVEQVDVVAFGVLGEVQRAYVVLDDWPVVSFAFEREELEVFHIAFALAVDEEILFNGERVAFDQVDLPSVALEKGVQPHFHVIPLDVHCPRVKVVDVVVIEDELRTEETH